MELDPLNESRPKWAEAIRRFVSDEVIDEKYEYPKDGSADDLLDEIETAVCDIFCRAYGHDIVDDQCGIPAHRYCLYCGRREPALQSKPSPTNNPKEEPHGDGTE